MQATMILESKANIDVGIAGKELLNSYSLERQPVGLDVVTQ